MSHFNDTVKVSYSESGTPYISDEERLRLRRAPDFEYIAIRSVLQREHHKAQRDQLLDVLERIVTRVHEADLTNAPNWADVAFRCAEDARQAVAELEKA